MEKVTFFQGLPSLSRRLCRVQTTLEWKGIQAVYEPLKWARRIECHPFVSRVLQLAFSDALREGERPRTTVPAFLVHRAHSSPTRQSVRHPNALLCRWRPQGAMRKLRQF